MDKVMLGLLSNMIEVGYYENANKLTTIPTMAITSLGTVMLPRISNLIANGDIENSKKYTEKSLIFSVILSSSMSFGLSAISKEFVPFFYGTGYEKCIQLIPILVFATNFIFSASTSVTFFIYRLYSVSSLSISSMYVVIIFHPHIGHLHP